MGKGEHAMSDSIASEYVLAPTSATNTATSASSTSAIDITSDANASGWYDFSIKGADVHIIFGNSSVAAATTGNGLYLPAGISNMYYITPQTRYYRAIATSTVSGQVVSVAKVGP